MKFVVDYYFDSIYWSNYFDLLLIALCIALYLRFKQEKEELNYFTIFLLITCVVEIIVANFVAHNFGSNTIVYNLFFIFCINYYAFLFQRHQSQGENKTSILYWVIPWTLFSLFNLFFYQGLHFPNTFSWITGMVLIIVIVINYFLHLIKDENIIDLKTDPLFILSIGILLMYASAFPLLSNLNAVILLQYNADMAIFQLVQYGNLILALSYLYIALCPILKLRWSKK